MRSALTRSQRIFAAVVCPPIEVKSRALQFVEAVSLAPALVFGLNTAANRDIHVKGVTGFSFRKVMATFWWSYQAWLPSVSKLRSELNRPAQWATGSFGFTPSVMPRESPFQDFAKAAGNFDLNNETVGVPDTREFGTFCL